MSLQEIQAEQHLMANVIQTVETLADLFPDAFILRGSQWQDNTQISATARTVLPSGSYDLTIGYTNGSENDKRDVWLRQTEAGHRTKSYCVFAQTTPLHNQAAIQAGLAEHPKEVAWLLEVLPEGQIHYYEDTSHTTIEIHEALGLLSQITSLQAPVPGLSLRQFREAQSAQQNSRPKLT